MHGTEKGKFMKFSIEFDGRYKGKAKDALKQKVSSFFWTFFIGLLVTAAGFYTSTLPFYRVITPVERVFGIAVMVGGITLIIASPFVGIFKGFNRGFKGKMHFFFEKKDGEEEWNYILSATKNGVWYEEYGKVSLIDIKGNIASLRTDKAKDYYIPLRALTDEERHNLAVTEKEVRDYRIEETRKRREAARTKNRGNSADGKNDKKSVKNEENGKSGKADNAQGGDGQRG